MPIYLVSFLIPIHLLKLMTLTNLATAAPRIPGNKNDGLVAFVASHILMRFIARDNLNRSV